MDKNTWKEIAVFLVVLWAIYFVIQMTAPFLAISFWDTIRNVLIP